MLPGGVSIMAAPLFSSVCSIKECMEGTKQSLALTSAYKNYNGTSELKKVVIFPCRLKWVGLYSNSIPNLIHFVHNSNFEHLVLVAVDEQQSKYVIKLIC